MQHILITGGAGFIGSSLAEQLINDGYQVTAIDNFDPFYDQNIKKRNLAGIINHPSFRLLEVDICNMDEIKNHINDDFDIIVHLAAKAGVHASIKTPVACQQANVMGTQHMLEFAKEKGIKQFVFASSSSVYGVNPNVPWEEADQQMMPISPYASSKLSCELLGHVYTHLYGIRFIALRFFTVYGPRQRPDLAIHKFAKKIQDEVAIPVFGDGSTRRDYTYINDVLSGVRAAMDYSDSNYEIINLGNHKTVSLSEMVSTIEEVFEKKAIINRLPMQPGDVPQTYADISKAKRLLGYQPNTTFKEGITQFRTWMEETQDY
ncbi:MAG: UDP-glucuronate 4-epimerase [Maribacter sp.]|jgi:UDP-glucuronate 4-epimerase